jgi:hypothetical protein
MREQRRNENAPAVSMKKENGRMISSAKLEKIAGEHKKRKPRTVAVLGFQICLLLTKKMRIFFWSAPKTKSKPSEAGSIWKGAAAE